MPSTSKKQAAFMRAVAHSPAFAKKVGVSQSVGKDFAAADKGKKFRTGGRMAAINKQDTRHGAVDMPFKSVRKFAGMKAGGKVKRYGDGGDVEEFLNRERTESDVAEKAAQPDASAPKYTRRKVTPSYGNEGRRAGASPKGDTVSATPSSQTNAGAVTGRTMYSKSMPSDEQKDANTENFRDLTMTAASMTPIGRGLAIGAKGIQAASAARAAKLAGAMDKAATGTAAQVRRSVPKFGGAEPRNSILDEARKRAIAQGRTASAKEAAIDAEREAAMAGMYRKGGSVKYAKGGSVKEESKAMMKKEVNFFKKKGAPASMIKHEESEMKGMKAGGMARSKKDIARDQMAMAPYARGGGIESKGKTQGKIIKMAAGGSVSARADGIAQRGKTKFKMC